MVSPMTPFWRARFVLPSAVLLSALAVGGCESVPFATDASPGPGRIPVATYDGPAPSGSAFITKVSGRACRRNPWDVTPRPEDAIMEMKIAATSSGADGIVNMTCTAEVPNPMTLCWQAVYCSGDAVKMAR